MDMPKDAAIAVAGLTFTYPGGVLALGPLPQVYAGIGRPHETSGLAPGSDGLAQRTFPSATYCAASGSRLNHRSMRIR